MIVLVFVKVKKPDDFARGICQNEGNQNSGAAGCPKALAALVRYSTSCLDLVDRFVPSAARLRYRNSGADKDLTQRER